MEELKIEKKQIKVIYNKSAGYLRGYFPLLKNIRLHDFKKFYIPKVKPHLWPQMITRSFHDLGNFQVRVVVIHNVYEARREARKSLIQKDYAIICVGGDGTLNQIANVIARSNIILGIIPSGTVNSAALALGIPINFEKALKIMLDQNVRSIDLGKANGRYFINCLGVGMDAYVVRDIERSRWKKRCGVWGYILSVFKAFLFFKGRRIFVQIGEKEKIFEVWGLIIGNMRYYAGEFILGENHPARNFFYILLLKKKKYFRYLFKLITGKLHQDKDVEVIKDSYIRFFSKEPVFYQLDGDLAGELPVTVLKEKKALRVFLPRN